MRRLAWGAVLFAGVASAQTGVSEDRVSLPDGPGSLEGVGDNVGIDANMAAMRHSVSFTLPQGHPGATPSLSLRYGSGGGGSVAGIGWSLAVPSIERMTSRGLPEYDRDDLFAADGSDELVRLPDTDPPRYRARYEGGFVRYTWMDAGDGRDGWWLAEYPDGAKGYFGADASGRVVADARLADAGRGTFRYMLVDRVDVHDHAVRYSYTKDGVVPLLSRVEWARYAVALGYEARRDASGLDHLSDATPGFETVLSQRLATVDVFSGAERIRRYRATYEPYATSGGATRLTGVRMEGLDGGAYPIAETYTYSKALGGVCADAEGCARPFLVDMGTLGDVVLGADSATLVDINGDALPDVVDTREGAHRFFLNEPTIDGEGAFGRTVTSRVGTSSGHRVGSTETQVMDVNGDGFSDLVNLAEGTVLYNRGAGDWLDAAAMRAAGLETVAPRFDVSLVPRVAYLDFDHDKRIDFLVSDADATTVYRNDGAGAFVVAPGVQALGDGTSGGDLDFADVNGDGLLDATIRRPGVLRHRLNLGHGRWAEWREMSHPFEDGLELERADLKDLNGDGLDDLVVVEPGAVRYVLNVSGITFAEEASIDGGDLDAGALPERGDDVQVLFADMNGNGSTDVVWVERTGGVRYLELFPVRPNLLSRVENGIGKVTDVTYGTSVRHMARDAFDGRAWAHRLPHPMIVVDSIDDWDPLTGNHERVEYRYHDGFYDGVEKQFRGYADVETASGEDETQERGRTTMRYDVGAEDTYRKGLLLEQTESSGERLLSIERFEFEDCPVAEVPDLERPVRHVCEVSRTAVVVEGAEAAAQATIETRTTWDGYGNAVRVASLGVTKIGGGACAPCDGDEFGAPCGAECRGDEVYTETEYVPPSRTGGRWILHAPFRARTRGTADGDLYTETLTYYDGEAFVGAELGTLTRGDVTRATQKVDGQKTITTLRQRFDAHGNVIETIDPLGAPGGNTHRRLYTYDDDGLRIVRTEYLLEDAAGPYRLRRDLAWDPAFDRIVEGTGFLLVVDGEVTSPRRSSFFGYDEFGRLLWRANPGDTPEAPTQVFAYDLRSPASRIVTRTRSRRGADYDLESVSCLDGRGRVFQSRTKLAGDRWFVDGFAEYNTRGSVVRTFQSYTAASGACDTAPPADVRAIVYRRDATERLLEMVHPDADERGGTPSVVRATYGPLWSRAFDEEDTDAASPHRDTPATTRTDGQGRTVALERALADGMTAVTRLHYDALGRLAGYTDAAGHRKRQTYDLMGRLLRVDDPNAGANLWTYDDAGNVLTHTDGRGAVTTNAYDGLNRLVGQWDAAAADATRITYVYDRPETCPADECTHAEGHLAEVRFPAGADFFGRDDRGQVVFSRRTVGDASYAIERAFDNAGRAVASTYPGGRRVVLELDGLSRVVRIPGVVEAAEYDDRGLLVRRALADGTVHTRTWDARMRPATMRTTGRAGDVLQGFDFGRDRVGNLLEVEDANPGDGPRHDAQVTYDAWYRPTTMTLAEGALDLGYDALDNIVSHSDLGGFTYDSERPNALAAAGAIAFAYDDGGHVVERDGRRLERDFLRRVTAIDGIGTYTFGAGAGRVAKVEGDARAIYVDADFEVRDGVGVVYVSQAGERVARLESVLEPVTAADAWRAQQAGGDPAAKLAAAATALLVEGRETTFLHEDWLRGVTLATRDGAATGRQVFSPTGVAARPASIDPHGFAGVEADASGLAHFGLREYDPRVARWLSPDPAFLVATEENVSMPGESTTGYAYAGNQFLNAWDVGGAVKHMAYLPAGHAESDADDHIKYSFIESEYVHGGVSYVSEANRIEPNQGGLHQLDDGGTIHVVGHGNWGTGIGSKKNKMTPDQLLAGLLSDGLDPNKRVTIELYACNSGASVEGALHQQGMKTQASYAERFAKAIKADGRFKNVKVIGYGGIVGSDGTTKPRYHMSRSGHWYSRRYEYTGTDNSDKQATGVTHRMNYMNIWEVQGGMAKRAYGQKMTAKYDSANGRMYIDRAAAPRPRRNAQTTR